MFVLVPFLRAGPALQLAKARVSGQIPGSQGTLELWASSPCGHEFLKSGQAKQLNDPKNVFTHLFKNH